MKRHLTISSKAQLLGCLLSIAIPQAMAQQMIQNPLIRPPTLETSGAEGGSGSGAIQAPGGIKGASSGAAGADPGATEDLRAKAASRITQEDLNVRQQELNAAVVPAPLQIIFSNMYVAAHAKGAIVLRRFEGSAPVQAAQTSTPVSQNGQEATIQQVPQQPAGVRSAQPGPNVLRFHEGRVMNINGYKLLARLNGLDVTVDWMTDKDQAVNVFFGAVESAPGYARVPDQNALQKVQKENYRYLVPVLSSRGLTSNNASNTQQPANSSPNQNQNAGFGTSAPIFPN